MKASKRNLLLTGIVIATSLTIYSYKQSQLSTQHLSELALKNIEALSTPEDCEKKYRYSYVHGAVCYVDVGKTYAEGKEVICFPGNEHPVCVKCALVD